MPRDLHFPKVLRNNNRHHAISFGQFYLKAFGDRADWADIKDAFQTWNIDMGSSFIGQSASDIDPQLMQTFIGIATALDQRATPRLAKLHVGKVKQITSSATLYGRF
jgi:hypothetical protein